jgi:allantoicase
MTDPALHLLPDLASRALGGGVVWANDELFAERENLIKAAPPAFQPHTFGHKGQIMDGWETRRRRTPGIDEAIVRLGAPGIVRGVVVDTSYFTGNYPPEISLEACAVDGYPEPQVLHEGEWQTLIERTGVHGDTANEFSVDDPQRFTHVKLTMYPDGGVSRLRVRGSVVADPRLLTECFDLAALENGGRVIGASNMFYSSPSNLIMPGNARVMGDGWETSRRRDDANDWVDVALACAGTIALAELDTSCFVGNAPGWAALTAADGTELLPRTALQPDTRHRFVIAPAAPLEQVRLSIYPDGGMARLRLIGRPTAAGRDAIGRRFLDSAPPSHLRAILRASGVEAEAAASAVAARGSAGDSSIPEMFAAALRPPG